MKAFQLKITIKNSKPPIWRRVIVPTGITFSQLSMILNEVMGWSGYHLFEFEFYHKELRIIEGADEIDLFGPYDYLEASTTFIREFMEENDWFTYTYDLGDDWQHRVAIERIIDDWEYNYPKVIKYKGDCPIEDCGGIYGYYECLEIISDANHSEYEERLDWMESQGYPQEYDLDYTNGQLQNLYFYKVGKREHRCQSEIYEEHFSGKNGLQATKNDKNKNLNLIQSKKHKVEDSLQKMADLMKQYVEMQKQLESQMPKVSTLKEIFNDYEKSDLIDIAREKGVSGALGKNKTQIIEKLYAFMMDDAEIKKYFYCMDASTREEFQKALDSHGYYESETSGILTNLYKGAYIGILEDGSVMIPEDVKNAYRKLCSAEFEKECDKRSYILYCLETVKQLYGIVPVDVFVELVNKRDEEKLAWEEVQQILEKIPVEYMEFVIKNNRLYHKEFWPDDKGLLNAQGNKRYYIPTKAEIVDIGLRGYLSEDKYIQKFQKYLISQLGAMEDEAEFAGRMIWRLICGDYGMQAIFDVLEDLGLMVDSEKELHSLVKEINQLWNNTRKILNRGYTPDEMRQRETIFSNPMKNNIVNFEEARKTKVYPNDPCPCGSGKKYKNCCKNKK